MNVLEHYIEEVLVKRPLNEEETNWAIKTGRNPEDYVVVKWRYNCYGSKNVTENLYSKDDWKKIETRGYDLM